MNWRCLFRHNWILTKTFQRELYKKTTWEGYQCTACKKRKLEKTRNYEYYNGAESDREACDWLSEKIIPVQPKIKILHKEEK